MWTKTEFRQPRLSAVGCFRPRLSNARFSNARFSNAPFSNARLSNAPLSNARLSTLECSPLEFSSCISPQKVLIIPNRISGSDSVSIRSLFAAPPGVVRLSRDHLPRDHAALPANGGGSPAP
ncbi:MAG: pentapeptide repeat-containing protein [Bacteroidetes bacterium]|nr:pentapeptide repeat-containing protein [Bacteroidota bacterium]